MVIKEAAADVMFWLREQALPVFGGKAFWAEKAAGTGELRQGCAW